MTRIAACLLAFALIAGSCATDPEPGPDAEEPPAVAQPLDLSGAWAGDLQAGGVTLRIVFRLSADGSGGYAALMDSPDQGARDIAVSAVKVEDREVRLEVAVAGAFFQGTLDPQATQMDGIWNQSGARLPLVLARGHERPPRPQETPGAADIADTWSGRLAVGAVSLRMVFHIGRDEGGRYTGRLDSPDEGLRDIPVSAVSVNGTAVRLEIAAVGAVVQGSLDPDAATIQGTWGQRGVTVPLVLKRGEVAAERRPQVPVEPFAYRVQEVTTRNETDNVTLAGTLTVPPGNGPFPAVLLTSGSGQQNRDEEIFGHKPFLVLSDALTRAGIAVLRYDDRGVGDSTGNPAQDTTLDFSRDALAMFRHLAATDGVDPGRVGLVGHSEGGLIACMLAASTPEVAFVVLLAGPGLPGDELLLLQNAALIRASGFGEEMVTADQEFRRQAHALAKAETDLAQARQELGDLLRSTGVPEGQVEVALAQFLSPWMRFYLRYDPGPDLERMRQPVLALIGTKDLQVPPKENLAAIRQAAVRGGNQSVTTLEMEGLNHLFQTAPTGLPAEYGTIEETMAPVVLSTVADWVLAR